MGEVVSIRQKEAPFEKASRKQGFRSLFKRQMPLFESYLRLAESLYILKSSENKFIRQSRRKNGRKSEIYLGESSACLESRRALKKEISAIRKQKISRLEKNEKQIKLVKASYLTVIAKELLSGLDKIASDLSSVLDE